MTRATLKATLRRVYALLGLVLAICLFAKFVDHIAWLRGSGLAALLKDTYELLRDMSLLIATGGVAFITNVFQKRSSFIAALKEEWRDIIAAKSVLFSYTQLEKPTARALSRNLLQAVRDNRQHALGLSQRRRDH